MLFIQKLAFQNGLEDTPQSMYVFEGTDYSNLKEPSSADVQAFADLVAGKSVGIHTVMSSL